MCLHIFVIAFFLCIPRVSPVEVSGREQGIQRIQSPTSYLLTSTYYNSNCTAISSQVAIGLSGCMSEGISGSYIPIAKISDHIIRQHHIVFFSVSCVGAVISTNDVTVPRPCMRIGGGLFQLSVISNSAPQPFSNGVLTMYGLSVSCRKAVGSKALKDCCFDFSQAVPNSISL